jgi:broad specificity phosphatase PhoE
MSELILIRHAQASFGEENYDKLSDLGHKQAQLLGNLLKGLEISPDKVVIGTQKRHLETFEELGLSCHLEKHSGWNEYDFKDLLLAEFGSDIPSEIFTDRKIHFRTLRATVTKWMNNEISGTNEKWADFALRVKTACEVSCDLNCKQVVVVTSGGPISRVVSTTLNTPKEEMMNLNLQIKNTSISRFIFTPRSFYLHSFNATPQFDGDQSNYMSFS